MKKTLLFIYITYAMLSFAKATLIGSAKVEAGIEVDYKKDIPTQKASSFLKFSGEIGVKDYGFSAGTDLKFEKKDNNGVFNNSSIASVIKDKDSKVWAKYELPPFETIKSEIKITYQFDQKSEIATKISTDIEKVNLTFKTSYSAKNFIFKDYLFKFSLDGKAKITDTIELNIGFGSNLELQEKNEEPKNGHWMHKQEQKHYILGNLGLKYTGFEDLVLEVSQETEVKLETNFDYGKVKLNAGATYTGIENLTLKSKVEIVFSDLQFKENKIPVNKWSVKPEASAQYKYTPIKQLSFMPKFAMIAEVSEANTMGNLILEPSVKMEYKPIDDLIITGNVEMPLDVKLTDSNGKSNNNTYKTPDFKTKFKLSVQYRW